MNCIMYVYNCTDLVLKREITLNQLTGVIVDSYLMCGFTVEFHPKSESNE